jgi:hypothetical protein
MERCLSEKFALPARVTQPIQHCQLRPGVTAISEWTENYRFQEKDYFAVVRGAPSRAGLRQQPARECYGLLENRQMRVGISSEIFRAEA